MDLVSYFQVPEKSDPSLFSVQHFCLHDGPGTRSIVFFKGCPLRCEWCQNPESWSRKSELAYKQTLCINCNTCVEQCPENAFSKPGEWDKDKCTLCFKCVDTCPSGALTQFGTNHSVNEILEKLRPTIDLVLFDLKIFDDKKHKQFCGVSNKEIKQNLETLALLAKQKRGPQIWPRLPLIPGKTNSSKNLNKWANFLLNIGITNLTIVPYHNLGVPKRSWLGLEPAPDIPSLSDKDLKESIELLSKAGITCYAPGEEYWN